MNVSQKQQRRRPVAEINVVPYIDVMLVLLVIFMITAPLLSQGVNVDLPKANAKALADEREPIIVSVDSRGQYFLNTAVNPEQTIPKEQITALVFRQLEQAKVQHLRRNVFVKGDRNVNYGAVVEVMVLLQKAGVENVGLMTENPR